VSSMSQCLALLDLGHVLALTLIYVVTPFAPSQTPCSPQPCPPGSGQDLFRGDEAVTMSSHSDTTRMGAFLRYLRPRSLKTFSSKSGIRLGCIKELLVSADVLFNSHCFVQPYSRGAPRIPPPTITAWWQSASGVQ
jgi:hypothetical protein